MAAMILQGGAVVVLAESPQGASLPLQCTPARRLLPCRRREEEGGIVAYYSLFGICIGLLLSFFLNETLLLLKNHDRKT